MSERPSPHTTEVPKNSIRSKIRTVLMTIGLGATTLPATACHEGFAVRIVSGLAGGPEPTEEQKEIVHEGMSIIGVDEYRLIDDEVESYRGTMRLISISTPLETSVNGKVTSNSRCMKSAIIPAKKNIYPECEGGDECTYSQIATAHEVGHLLGLNHTCDCYDKCPSYTGIIPSCSKENTEAEIEGSCILCTGAEGEDKCTEENDTDLMNGAVSTLDSTYLSDGERDTVDKNARRFDRCIESK